MQYLLDAWSATFSALFCAALAASVAVSLALSAAFWPALSASAKWNKYIDNLLNISII